MIPTVEDILIDLAAGRITHAQAMAWMEQHFKLCAEEAFAPPEVAANFPRRSDHLLGKMIAAWFYHGPNEPMPTLENSDPMFFKRMGQVFDVIEQAAQHSPSSPRGTTK